MRVNLHPPFDEIGALAALFGVTPVPVGTPPSLVGGIATDSREVAAGDLFVALSGMHTSGDAFFPDALARGAAALLMREDMCAPKGNYWLFSVRDTRKALLLAAQEAAEQRGATRIGIGGSAGKTTVKEAVAAMLGTAYSVEKSEGNYNSDIGLSLSLLSMKGADFSVCELGISHKGEMAELSRALAPKLTVLTSIGTAHIGNFESFEELAAEKISIVAGQGEEDTLLAHESISSALLEKLPLRVLTVGRGAGANVRAREVRFEKSGVFATVAGLGRTLAGLSFSQPSSAGLSTLLFATAVGFQFGLTDAEIKRGLLLAGETTPRARVLEHSGFLLIDDTYNASPEAMVTALELLCYRGAGRALVAVLGDMEELGEAAPALHEAVGECAARVGVAKLYFIGNRAGDYRRGALLGGAAPLHIHVFKKDEGEALAAALLQDVPRGAAILFKASRKLSLDRVLWAVRRKK